MTGRQITALVVLLTAVKAATVVGLFVRSANYVQRGYLFIPSKSTPIARQVPGLSSISRDPEMLKRELSAAAQEFAGIKKELETIAPPTRSELIGRLDDMGTDEAAKALLSLDSARASQLLSKMRPRRAARIRAAMERYAARPGP